MLFEVTNKKVFTTDPVDGYVNVTAEDLNEISDFTLAASPLLPDAIPAWFRVRVTYDELSTAATTNNIELYELPAGGVIHAVMMKTSAAFTGGSISAYTLSVGITGTLNKYAAAFNVFQAVAATTFQLSTTQGAESFTAATSIKIAATSTSDDLDAATAGSVDVYLLMSQLPLPA
jgi:hypothetical protein